MGARFNWIFHFGQPPRYAKDVKVIQLDISAEEIGHNKATEVALVGDGKAIVGQLNQALAGRQWFYPKDTPWRQMFTKKVNENAAQIRPQIHITYKRAVCTSLSDKLDVPPELIRTSKALNKSPTACSTAPLRGVPIAMR